MEVDRRRIMRRINKLEADLRELQRTRQQQRRGRPAPAWPTFPSSGAHERRQVDPAQSAHCGGGARRGPPVRHLDPTTRRLASRAASRCCSPTPLGFVRRLPHGLVEAFKSTLESVAAEADLLVHLVDATSPDPQGQIDAVLCSASSGRTSCPSCSSSTRPTRARDGAARGRSPRGQRRDLRRERRRLRPAARRDRRSPASPQRTSSCSCRSSGVMSWPRFTARARWCRRRTRRADPHPRGCPRPAREGLLSS